MRLALELKIVLHSRPFEKRDLTSISQITRQKFFVMLSTEGVDPKFH